MARFKANSANRTLIIHRQDCPEALRAATEACGCSPNTSNGRSRWFCEEDVSLYAVNHFMNGKFWTILPCQQCFGFLDLSDFSNRPQEHLVHMGASVSKSEDIVRIVAEGGGLTIRGRIEPEGWSFWSEGGTIDDEAEGDWREWTTNPVRSLDKLLPRDWPLYFPETIHPLFIEWFQERYDAAYKQLPPELQIYQLKWAGAQWRRIFVSNIKH